MNRPLLIQNSRILTHIGFWSLYYVCFSLIWVKNDNYFASFYLEFVLLPARVIGVYVMIYLLIPKYLVKKKYQLFILMYLSLLIATGLLQRLSDYFFYQRLLLNETSVIFDIASFTRSILLVNSTILFVAAVKIFQLYLIEVDKNQTDNGRTIELKSNRRIHLVLTEHILYVEGMGNYATYYMQNGDKIIVYTSIKAALEALPKQFIRLHRSYIVNTQQIDSYNNDNVSIAGVELPRAKNVTDAMLKVDIL